MGRRLVAHLQLSGCATERIMLLLLPLLPLLHSSFAATTAPLETYTETREVTDNGGNVFSCSYSLSYDPNTAKVYRQESSVTCEPNTNGKQQQLGQQQLQLQEQQQQQLARQQLQLQEKQQQQLAQQQLAQQQLAQQQLQLQEQQQQQMAQQQLAQQQLAQQQLQLQKQQLQEQQQQ